MILQEPHKMNTDQFVDWLGTYQNQKKIRRNKRKRSIVGGSVSLQPPSSAWMTGAALPSAISSYEDKSSDEYMMAYPTEHVEEDQDEKKTNGDQTVKIGENEAPMVNPSITKSTPSTAEDSFIYIDETIYNPCKLNGILLHEEKKEEESLIPVVEIIDEPLVASTTNTTTLEPVKEAEIVKETLIPVIIAPISAMDQVDEVKEYSNENCKNTEALDFVGKHTRSHDDVDIRSRTRSKSPIVKPRAKAKHQRISDKSRERSRSPLNGNNLSTVVVFRRRTSSPCSSRSKKRASRWDLGPNGVKMSHSSLSLPSLTRDENIDPPSLTRDGAITPLPSSPWPSPVHSPQTSSSLLTTPEPLILDDNKTNAPNSLSLLQDTYKEKTSCTFDEALMFPNTMDMPRKEFIVQVPKVVLPKATSRQVLPRGLYPLPRKNILVKGHVPTAHPPLIVEKNKFQPRFIASSLRNTKANLDHIGVVPGVLKRRKAVAFVTLSTNEVNEEIIVKQPRHIEHDLQDTALTPIFIRRELDSNIKIVVVLFIILMAMASTMVSVFL